MATKARKHEEELATNYTNLLCFFFVFHPAVYIIALALAGLPKAER